MSDINLEKLSGLSSRVQTARRQKATLQSILELNVSPFEAKKGEFLLLLEPIRKMIHSGWPTDMPFMLQDDVMPLLKKSLEEFLPDILNRAMKLAEEEAGASVKEMLVEVQDELQKLKEELDV